MSDIRYMLLRDKIIGSLQIYGTSSKYSILCHRQHQVSGTPSGYAYMVFLQMYPLSRNFWSSWLFQAAAGIKDNYTQTPLVMRQNVSDVHRSSSWESPSKRNPFGVCLHGASTNLSSFEEFWSSWLFQAAAGINSSDRLLCLFFQKSMTQTIYDL